MSPQNCRADSWRARLAALVDGELAAGEAREVRAHLAGCPVCAREVAVLERLEGAFLRLPEWDPPAGLSAEVMARIARRRRAWWPHRETWQPWLRVAYLGSLAASLLLGFERSGLRLAVSAPAVAVARGAVSEAAFFARAASEVLGPLGKLTELRKTAGIVGESLVKVAEAQSPDMYGAGALVFLVVVMGVGARVLASRLQRRVTHARLAG